MPQIQLLDGKKIPFTKSISGLELTKKISKSLEKIARDSINASNTIIRWKKNSF